MNNKRLGAMIVFGLVCLLLPACLEYQDVVYLIQIQDDGSAVATVAWQGLSDEKDGKALSRSAIIQQLKEDCLEEADEELKPTRCEVDAMPEVFGALIKPVKRSKDTVDAYKSYQLKDAKVIFNKLAFGPENEKSSVKYIKEQGSLLIQTEMAVYSKIGKSCTLAIQSPYPITGTNAEVVLGGHNLALWNCQKDSKIGLPVELAAAFVK